MNALSARIAALTTTTGRDNVGRPVCPECRPQVPLTISSGGPSGHPTGLCDWCGARWALGPDFMPLEP
jgi:hypothetical protein